MNEIEFSDIYSNILMDGSMMVTLTVPKSSVRLLQEVLEEAKANVPKYLFSIFKRRQRRSLSANSYAWVLISKITEKMSNKFDKGKNAINTVYSKEEIYLEMLKHYGQSTIVSVRSDIPVKGFFKYFEEIGSGTVEGKKFTHYKIYQGSSEYTQQEMGVLIDGICQTAVDLGIQIMTPDEIEKMKSVWGVE